MALACPVQIMQNHQENGAALHRTSPVGCVREGEAAVGTYGADGTCGSIGGWLEELCLGGSAGHHVELYSTIDLQQFFPRVSRLRIGRNSLIFVRVDSNGWLPTRESLSERVGGADLRKGDS